MKPAPFDYLRAESLSEALAELAEHGGDARVIAGGQSLGAILNMRILAPKLLIDINRLDELSAIGLSASALTTGALLRQADALKDGRIREHVPLLAQALPHVGHYQTRNRGTLGGSVAHADPSAEIPLCLATLAGAVELRSKRGRRTVPAAQFFRSALETARQPDELVTALHWPVRDAGRSYAFVEFSVREGDYALVAVACVVDTGGRGACALRIGFGGCGEAPQVVAFDVLAGPLEIEAVAAEAAGKIECRSDLMASANYRRQLARVLAGRALRAATVQEPAHA